ncbi:MAG: tyrosine-type recombinase/integrase [SAR324 cluster bacterium]|nr:tyrosine-type recombinase/integrase [SAR324 cluster bacterium]
MNKSKINLHEDLPFGTYPPRPSVNEMTSKFYTAEHDICDGQVKLLRTKQSGDVWQMRCWISSEKKYVKKSLRTKNFEDAQSKGRKLYYSMMGKLDSGQKLFTISSSELVEKYLQMQQDRVDGGFITQQRRSTIKTQLNHFMDFVGKDRKMDTITRERYKDYYLFRRRKKPDVKVPTLLNERATIGHIYKWALEQGYISQDRLPVWSELKVGNIGTRTAFNIEDYQILYGYLKNYTKDISDEGEIYNRKMIRDFILVQSNTGLRFGECRFLKWHYVSVVKGENKYPNVHIRVPAEISKVRKDRTSVGMRGDFFNRIKTYSNHTHPNDYVFSDMKTGEPLGKKVLYNMWHLIMRESGLGESLNDYTYYCLRHTFATYRLQYGKVDIRTLAKVMGCSVTYIEQHYDSARVENMTDYITRGVGEKSKDAFGDVILR